MDLGHNGWERVFEALSLRDSADGVMETPVRRGGAALGFQRHTESRFRSASPALSLLNGELPPQSPHFADLSAWDITEYRRTVRQFRSSRGHSMRLPSGGQHSAVAPGLLGDEMPPPSPMFADVPRQDIEGYRETIRRAKLARRNTMATQRTAQSPPGVDPLFASMRKASTAHGRPSLAGMMAQWPGDAPQQQQQQQRLLESPSSQGGYIDSLWTTAEAPALDADDWILSQEPPRSPLFADYHSEKAALRRRATSDVRPPDSAALLKAVGEAVAADLVRPGEIGDLDGDHERWFQVDVHSLFTSPFSAASEPKVTVREVPVYDKTSAPMVAVDADDTDVLSALERYLTLLSLKARAQPVGGSPASRHAKQRPTSLRVPSRSKLPPDIIDFHIPALSFMVRSKSAGNCTRGGADRRVRAVDLEAMVEAYLPHVYAELDTTGGSSSSRCCAAQSPSPPLADPPGAFVRSPSESSVATLSETPTALHTPFVGSDTTPPQAEEQRLGKVAPPKRLPQLRMRRALSSDGADMVDLEYQQPAGRRVLRAPASTLNLKGTVGGRTTSPIYTPGACRMRKPTPIGAAPPPHTALPRPHSEILSSPREPPHSAYSAQRLPWGSPLLYAPATLDAKARGLSPRSSVLSTTSSRTSVVTDGGMEAAQRRAGLKPGLQKLADGVPVPGKYKQPMEQQRASLRSRKDLTPLALSPALMASGFARGSRPSLGAVGGGVAAPLLTPTMADSGRRRGISTGSQSSAGRPAIPSGSGIAMRYPIASSVPPGNAFDARPRTAPLRLPALVAPQSATVRRPDGRQMFAMAYDGLPDPATSGQPAPRVPMVPDAGERTAVRQRLGAKLLEFRSRIFSP